MYSPGRAPTARRTGVTLTELLVAVSIIAVLLSLTFGLFTFAERTTKRYQTEVAKVSTSHRQAAYKVPRSMPLIKQVPNQYTVKFSAAVTNPRAEALRMEA